MKLTLPESKVELYKTGFDEDDMLERKDFSKRLSELVEKFEEPCVIALDGAWGSGKSYFLKRWVAAHSSENNGTATTVYFDAFQNDFLEDPLIGLVGTISERFEAKGNSTKSAWKKGKRIAARLWRPALRVGASVATAGVTEATGPVLDALFQGTQAEIDAASEKFWKREDGKRAAISEFKEFLKSQVSAPSDSTKRKIVVVVDELDRCRPDYALSMLETIKHFFTVPNVHFILGANLAELENIVRYRYGLQTAARDYVRKFISFRVQLPSSIPNRLNRSSWEVFLESSAKRMELNSEVSDGIVKQLRWIKQDSIGLRTAQRLLSEIALCPRLQAPNMSWPFRLLLDGLLIISCLEPQLIVKARKGTITLEDVESVFNFKKDQSAPDQDVRDSYLAYAVWCHILRSEKASVVVPAVSENIERQLGLLPAQPTVSNLVKDYIDFASIR